MTNADAESYFNALLFNLMGEWAPIIINPHTSAATIEELATELLFHNTSAVKYGAPDAARKIRQQWASLRGEALKRAGVDLLA